MLVEVEEEEEDDPDVEVDAAWEGNTGAPPLVKVSSS